MPFLIKILFAALVFMVIGSFTLVALTDVQIPQEDVKKTISNERYLK